MHLKRMSYLPGDGIEVIPVASNRVLGIAPGHYCGDCIVPAVMKALVRWILIPRHIVRGSTRIEKVQVAVYIYHYAVDARSATAWEAIENGFLLPVRSDKKTNFSVKTGNDVQVFIC